MKWLPESARRAAQMWAGGATFKEIAETLGTTRSTIAGFVRRKGLNRYSEKVMGANMGGWNQRPKDENGWRIPTEGTKSRLVYDLTIAGKSLHEIAADTGMPFTDVNALLAQLKPPKIIEPEDVTSPKMVDVVPAAPPPPALAEPPKAEAPPAAAPAAVPYYMQLAEERRQIREQYGWRIGERVAIDNVVCAVMGERRFERWSGICTIKNIKYKDYVFVESDDARYFMWITPENYQQMRRLIGSNSTT